MSKNLYPAKISTSLSDFDLDNLILECYAVRRPLYVPSMLEKYGEVLSHSAVMCITARGAFIVEFMSDNIVYIKKVGFYVSSEDFDFEDFHFVHDSHETQVPVRPVTIKRFAVSMANFMAGKKFDTFTHNCHYARYYTMKKYGMQSMNPKKVKRNILFQGIVDYFTRSKKDRKKTDNSETIEEKSSDGINCELTQMSD